METLRYHRTLRILHWLMAFVLLGLIAVGWTMKEIHGLGPLRGTLYSLHKSFGVIALLLIAVRIMVRFSTPVPPLPEGMKSIEKLGAKAGHLLLYVGMVTVPLSGFIMSMASGKGIKLFGFPLPNLMAINKPLSRFAYEMHELLPYILLAVIAAHVAGALKHRFFDAPENDVLPRMGFSPRRQG